MMRIEMVYEDFGRRSVLKIIRDIELADIPSPESLGRLWGLEPDEVATVIERCNYLSGYLVKSYIAVKGFPKILVPENTIVKEISGGEVSYSDVNSSLQVKYAVTTYLATLYDIGRDQEILKEAAVHINNAECFNMYETYYEYYRACLLGLIEDPAFLSSKFTNYVEAFIGHETPQYYKDVCVHLFGAESWN